MTADSELRQRRSRLPIILPTAFVVVLAVIWTGVWFYGAGRAQTAIAAWFEQEAKAGRVFTCGTQSFAGFPFRFEFECTGASVELRNLQPPVAATLKKIVVVAQVYQPTLLISEYVGPLGIGAPGQPPQLTANWSLAESSVRGMPQSVERISLVLDKPVFARATPSGQETLLQADHMEVHLRRNPASMPDNLIVDAALALNRATSPLHPLVAQPLDADVVAVLRGLKDLAPKPLAERLREFQAAGGRLELTSARVRQGETIATAGGTLGLSPNARLDGTLRLTIAGIEHVMKALGGLDKLAPSAANQGVPALNGLDRLVPGLGSALQRNASPGLVAAGLAMIGEPTEIEGRRATALPLRFADGNVFFGPIPLGPTPPLY